LRYYILDDVVDPLDGQPLRVVNAMVVERSGEKANRCRFWCAYHGASPDGVPLTDCERCAWQWIVSGELKGGNSSYPIIDGIPRLLPDEPLRQSPGAATQESFGYEWEHFDALLPDYEQEVQNYFHIVPENKLEDAMILDAGCGMGRWAHYVCRKPIRRLYALDFSRSIDRSARTLANMNVAHCIQADVCRLPFRPQTFDFVYSLGVLHHLENPDLGMASLVKSMKENGALLVYLYYALENRPAFYRAIFGVITWARRMTSKLPKPWMHRLAWVIGVCIYLPLARFAWLLEKIGLRRAAKNIPLYHYRNATIRFMVGDAFDRFATPIENRYKRTEIEAWLNRYDLSPVFSERTPYWVAYSQRISGKMNV
jgi:SAM-dependent methyltransferase